MNNVDIMRAKNITFRLVAESEAERIMQNEYSYHMLMRLACVFEKKRKSSKDEFVGLDFGHLYYLAKIDFRLSQILMGMCLEIEKSLKTRLIYDAEKVCVTKKLLDEYYDSEKEYLAQTYTSENIDSLNDGQKLADISFYQFLDIVQFGTLERFIHFFYKKYSKQIYGTEFPAFETRLYAVRRIRNTVAHNNSIVGKMQEQTEYKNLKISAILGRYGIKNRTLRTNMSRAVISDLCDLLYVYCELIDDGEELLASFEDFDKKYIQKYKNVLVKNDLLRSTYIFYKAAIHILLVQKKLDKRDAICYNS